jgi:uncharacterized protein (TIGR03086 family)
MATLLERSAGYAMGVVAAVAPEFLSRPTPCAGWDLRMLLEHVNESLAALHEGLTGGRVALLPPGDWSADPVCSADPVLVFRDRARLLLRATAAADCLAPVGIADRSVPAGVMIAMASIEIAVHGWDVSQACGQRLPVPHELAADLLEQSVLLVPRAGRYPLFGPPVPVPRGASPSDRLAAFLGRASGLTRLPPRRVAFSHRSPSHLLSDACCFFRVWHGREKLGRRR